MRVFFTSLSASLSLCHISPLQSFLPQHTQKHAYTHKYTHTTHVRARGDIPTLLARTGRRGMLVRTCCLLYTPAHTHSLGSTRTHSHSLPNGYNEPNLQLLVLRNTMSVIPLLFCTLAVYFPCTHKSTPERVTGIFNRGMIDRHLLVLAACFDPQVSICF